MIKWRNPMINCGPRCAMLYFFAHWVPQFIIGFQKISSGYEILAPGYKFRGWQFESPGYTRTLGAGVVCHILDFLCSKKLCNTVWYTLENILVLYKCMWGMWAYTFVNTVFNIDIVKQPLPNLKNYSNTISIHSGDKLLWSFVQRIETMRW